MDVCGCGYVLGLHPRHVRPSTVGALDDDALAFQTLLPDALQILGTALSGSELLNRIPLARIDARSRADVADLWRVFELEPQMQTGWRWLLPRPATGDQQVLVLEVLARKPARCTFAVAFRLPMYREFLEDAAALGAFALTVAPLATKVRCWRFCPPRDELLSHIATVTRSRY